MKARWVRLSITLFTQHVDILETQMFATFVDHKIMSQWMDPEQSIKVFDTRNLKASDSPENSNEDQLRTSYEKCDTLEETGKLCVIYINNLS